MTNDVRALKQSLLAVRDLASCRLANGPLDRNTRHDLSEIVRIANEAIRPTLPRPVRTVTVLRWREDGWPICPLCDDDELWSGEITKPTPETVCACYRCGELTLANARRPTEGGARAAPATQERKGAMAPIAMNTLTGLGIWIWELGKCEGGSVAAIVAKAKKAGVSWLAVKCGEESSDGQVTRALVEGLVAGGIRPVVWWYCRPEKFASQIAMLVALKALGVTAFLMDAEAEWDVPDQKAEASTFAKELRAALGDDVFLADAPWARPLSHGGFFPYAEFGAVMNARMPQAYWELAEVAGEPFASFMPAVDAQWAKVAPGETICPAFSTLNKDGSKHAPVAELAQALDRYADRAAVSIWSWQHLNAAEWALLDARATTPIADVLAGAPVAGLEVPGENA